MFSYHNHSNMTDGHSDPEEMLVSAYNHGIKEYGFSDHYGICPFNGYYGLKDLDQYIKTILNLKECYAHKLVVRIGLECDFFPQTQEEQTKLLKNYPLDYIIGGLHYIDEWPVDLSKENWTELSESEIHNKIIKYWEFEYNMIKNADIDIVAHIDLYNKWGAFNSRDYSEYFVECIKAIVDRGLVLEMNTNKKTNIPEDFYPNDKFMEILSDYDIPMIISSDAHYPVHVTRNFDIAEKLFEKYKIKTTAKFEKRQKTIIPINF